MRAEQLDGKKFAPRRPSCLRRASHVVEPKEATSHAAQNDANGAWLRNGSLDVPSEIDPPSSGGGFFMAAPWSHSSLLPAACGLQ
jgi:hypothetical protein